MIKLFCAFALLFTSAVQAGQCYEAQKQSKKLEAITEGVLFLSEGDSPWSAFSSLTPIAEITEKGIRKALNLKDTIYGEKAYFEMSKDHTALYSFIRSEIESLEDYADEEGDEEYLAGAKKLKKLISDISKKYGKDVRLVLYGAGDGDGYFGGDHMIVIIMKNGCVFGLKADTVWT